MCAPPGPAARTAPAAQTVPHIVFPRMTLSTSRDQAGSGTIGAREPEAEQPEAEQLEAELEAAARADPRSES